MRFLRALFSKVVAWRVRPLDPDWWPRDVGSVLVVGTCSPEFAAALAAEVRRRGRDVPICFLAGRETQASAGGFEALVAQRGARGWLGTLRAVRNRRFAACLIPLTGEGGRALKTLGVLSSARHLVLCPAPEQWHSLSRPRLSPRALFAPLVGLASKVVALVSITARCSCILLRRRVHGRPRLQ
jgi:hypothetical protein